MNQVLFRQLFERVAKYPNLPIILVGVSIALLTCDLGLQFSGIVSVWPVIVAVLICSLGMTTQIWFKRQNKLLNVGPKQSDPIPESGQQLPIQSGPVPTPDPASVIVETLQHHLNKCSVMIGVTVSGDPITYLMPTVKGINGDEIATVLTIASQLRQNGVQIEVLCPERTDRYDLMNPKNTRYMPTIPFFPMPKSFLSKN